MLAAASYADTAGTGIGLVADKAATRESAKYANLTASYILKLTAEGNLGPLNASATEFISNLGQKIGNLFSDNREAVSFYSRISL